MSVPVQRFRYQYGVAERGAAAAASMPSRWRALLLVLVLLGATRPVAAVELDLTAVGSSGVINGALFREASEGAGSGMYINLYSVQGHHQTGAYESGFNTSASTQPLDSSSGRDLSLGEVSLITIDSVLYAIFGLDANENDGYISLNDVEIWVSQTAGLATYCALQSSATLLYDMDAGEDSAIAINAGGSGASDMEFCLPFSAFSGYDITTTWVYVYSEMGGYRSAIGTISVADLDWTAGFEEWAIPQGLPTPSAFSTAPEPGTALFGVMGLCLLMGTRSRRRKA